MKRGAVHWGGMQEDEQAPCAEGRETSSAWRVMSVGYRSLQRAGLELGVKDAFAEDIWMLAAGLSYMPRVRFLD